ncbi:copper chaperone for superoxide dismutase isoform X2 [Anoplophora glabripennis]|nr:copper chaperone for superoxide dismutase isoform X2 [Anoplophora glabripennis]
MTCDSCVEAVKKSLENVEGIKSVDIDLKKGSVVVDSNLPITDVQRKLESTGRKVVVKGQAGSLAAVCILEASEESNIRGVIRFIQPVPGVCIIDGTIDDLKPKTYQISIHECGDLSRGCENVGNIYNPKATQNARIYGDLGTIVAQKNGRATFRLEDNVIKISEIIGRSFVLTDKTEDSGIQKKLAAGIIARSAGLFQNPKTICACDGVTIWDETSKPKSTL